MTTASTASTAALNAASKTGTRLVAVDDEPNPDRAGLVVMEEGRPFEHYCVTCGAWGAFGYDVDPVRGRLGRWYCNAHRPDRAGAAGAAGGREASPASGGAAASKARDVPRDRAIEGFVETTLDSKRS